MECLRAGWRMAYIEQGETPECFFCEFLSRPGEDEKNGILLRGESCMVMLNAFPYNCAHIMVAPNRHISSLADLTPEEVSEFMRYLTQCQEAIEREYHPQGFNIGMNLGRCAGAGVPGHIHAHMIPRWTGDTNFMPIIAETKVLPESLERTYQRLKRALSECA